MKKALIALTLALAILCCAAAACAEGDVKRDQLKVGLRMNVPGKTGATMEAGDTVQITLRITNASGADFASEMYLFDPAKERAGEFPLLKDGESAEWSGEWTVTEEQMEAGKFTYRLQFKYFDENGESKASYKNLNMKISDVGKKAAVKYAPVFLYCVQDNSHSDGKTCVFCIDEEGIVWSTAEADLKPGYSEEDLMRLIQERRGMTRRTETLHSAAYGMYTDDELKELAQWAASVPAAEGTPEETGVDTDETAIYALKNGEDGHTESILLGMSGRRLFENTDADAQALYQFMWAQLYWEVNTFRSSYGFAAEGVAPYGFRTVSVREFLGLEKVDAATAVITAVEHDSEAGPKEAEVTEKDREEVLAMLERGIITRKVNDRREVYNTKSYLFHTADGEFLGSMELSRGMAVTSDGMYQMSIPTESTGNLPEEEQKLLRVKIEGFDYQLGKTTVRDMIRDRWKCSLSGHGMYRLDNQDGTKQFVANGEGDSLDEPITFISSSGIQEGVPEYCGFDGYMDPENPEDPDTVWREKAREAAKANGEEVDEEYNPPFEGLYYWLSTGALGEVYKEPDYLGGEITVDVTLSDGRLLQIHATKSLPLHLILSEPAEPTADPTSRIIMYSVLKEKADSETFSVCCIDEAGKIWTARDVSAEQEGALLQLLAERKDMKSDSLLYNTENGKDILEDRFKDLAAMADLVEKAIGDAVPTGSDTGEERVYALKPDADGNPEPVLLGVCGSAVFENKDRNAQALYQFMLQQQSFTAPCSWAAEGLTPHGFQTVSVREFFGLESVNAETATITAAVSDSMTGLTDVQLTDEDRKKAQALLERGVVLGKHDPWIVTGGTMSYFFYDENGKCTGRIETCEEDSLAVGPDGMYTLSLLPESTEGLTEAEKQLLHLKINGTDYEIGKSTPRDLIRNGWLCTIEYEGTFAFTDEEGKEPFYIRTEGGSVDEPIRSINCQYADEFSFEYCGFDGVVDPDNPEDMDTIWNQKLLENWKAEHPELYSDPDEDGDEPGGEEEGDGLFWGPMELWMKTLGKADEDPDNSLDIIVTMSDGHTLRIYTIDSPPSLKLGDKEPIRLGPETEEDEW